MDLRALTTLEALQASTNATDRCFARQLKHAFTEDSQVGAELAADSNIQVSTSAAFLGQFWSNITGLQTALQTTPSLIGLFYNLIAGAGANGTAILRGYMGH